MSSQNNNKNRVDTNVKHSEPIPISSSFRRRSASVSSSSSGSASSTSDLPTPLSGSGSTQRIQIPSPGSSPILSYFLAQSPTKTPAAATFPFSRRFGANPPVFEEEEPERRVPVAAHARRASATFPGRFTQPQVPPIPESQQERGTGLLRRLSLSSTAFAKAAADSQIPVQSPPACTAPPNTAVSPIAKSLPFSRDTRPRRSATLTVDVKPRRAPSPMGERILKGHFDGFN